MRVRQQVKLLIKVFLPLTVFALFLCPQSVFAEISVDSYCQLTIESLQQQIPQTQELISIVNQYKDKPDILNQHLETKRAEFDQAKEALYSSYGTTAQEFVTYMDRNGKAVNAYLVAHPDVKQQIDDLSGQLNALMEQEEALMGAGGSQEPPLQ